MNVKTILLVSCGVSALAVGSPRGAELVERRVHQTGCGAIDISQPTTIGGVPNPLALPQDLGWFTTVNNLFRNIYFENISPAATGNAVESNFTYGADRFYSLTMRYRL